MGALAALDQEAPQVVIVSGTADLNLYRALRSAKALLLALVPEEDRAKMLEAFAAGVDDYQVGSISRAEIAARVCALLRNAKRPPPSSESSA